MHLRKFFIFLLAIVLLVCFCISCLPANKDKSQITQSNSEISGSNDAAEKEVSSKLQSELKEIYLAGGCFLGMEGYFRQVKGVIDTEVGYANGQSEKAEYENLEESGHAETLKITYNIHQIHTAELIDRFLRVIDPFSINRQGNDVGRQYRSGIYYTDVTDQKIATEFIEILESEHEGKTVAVEVLPLQQFIPAESYHQDYLEKNPGAYCHINLDDANELLYPGRSKPDDDSLRDELSQEAYKVTQEGDTEIAGSSPYLDFSQPGIYVDIVSGQPLFTTDDQYDSACGWPSFTMPITTDVIRFRVDNSLNMHRIEVKSDAADSHLGHVFPDGPKQESGLRYCINGASMRFIPFEKLAEEGYPYLIPYVQKR